jgi:Zinc-finger of C2H2 type
MEANGKYFCKICNFTTNKKGNWNNHIVTRKHLSNKNEKVYLCKCGLQYKHMSSLCKHRKKCIVTINNNNHIENIEDNISESNSEISSENETDTNMESGADKKPINTDLIMEFLQQSKDMQKLLIEQNRELQNTVVELSKKQTITNNYQQNNITNNNFNLNLFLNEQCKDAINMTDFLESIQLTVSDLEATGRLGYVPGISRILVNKLKELDVYTRPLHCTDLKRETVYVKNNNAWEKESSQKNKMRHVIKRIAKKNLQQLPAWQAQNPDFVKLDTPENNDFLKISLNSLGSCDPESEEKDMNKIMRNVFKEVVIEK